MKMSNENVEIHQNRVTNIRAFLKKKKKHTNMYIYMYFQFFHFFLAFSLRLDAICGDKILATDRKRSSNYVWNFLVYTFLISAYQNNFGLSNNC